MKNQELENKLKTAIEHVSKDNFQNVISKCDTEKGNVIPMKEITTKSNKSKFRIGTVAAVACIAIFACVGGLTWQHHQVTTVASIVSLDVNPSIELKINNNKDIISAIATNKDAEEILDGMDLKGTNVNVAVNAIIGSLLKHGYVDEIANSILVTVEDNNSERGKALQTAITEEIDGILADAAVNASILSQTMGTTNAELETLAQQYGISLGKASLIESIVAKSDHLTFDDIASLSINELNLLAESSQSTPSQISTLGTSASTGAYISLDEAQNSAFKHAGVTSADVKNLKVDYDYDFGRMVYEIDFYANNIKYEYDVDASTGDIIKNEIENKSVTSNTSSSSSADITSNQALEAAFKHANVNSAEAYGVSVKKDYDNNILVYEIEFSVGTTEYDYEISASDGSVVKNKKEANANTIANSSSTNISVDRAKEIALNHAGVAASDAVVTKSKLDYDDGVLTYDIEFISGNREYEYEINATTGDIYKSEQDIENDRHYNAANNNNSNTAPQTAQTPQTSSAAITADEAKNIALNHAGVSASNAYIEKLEQDRDDGMVTYEIEFRVGNVEYEYEVNASNGNVIKAEKDIDD